MPKRPIDLKARPLLDLASFARGGPIDRVQLSADQIALIDRTVRRVPEVMIKVLPKRSNDLKSVARHLGYIGRGGELTIETDDGQQIHDKEARDQLLKDWDLDLDESRAGDSFSAMGGRSPKLVHKIMLSMPPGTAANGVLAAARTFAREQFALKHRYALVLHTDEPHPHVHLVLKAVSEQGVRLNVKKANLRHWRSQFASHLRSLGVAANATERAVRGETLSARRDGVYRASLRGESTFLRARVEAIAEEAISGISRREPGEQALLETRSKVLDGWRIAADLLLRNGNSALAADVRTFMSAMQVPQTDQDRIRADLLAASRVRQR